MNSIIYSSKASENLASIRHNFDKEMDFILRNLEDFRANFTEFGKKNLIVN
jgi:hypothetical protein